MPHSDTKLPEQQCSKTHHNNKNNQTDTPPQIPSIKIVNITNYRKRSKQHMFNEKTSHTQPDDTSITQKETISGSNEKDEIWIELEDMSP